jgi:hypothetical protein
VGAADDAAVFQVVAEVVVESVHDVTVSGVVHEHHRNVLRE